MHAHLLRGSTTHVADATRFTQARTTPILRKTASFYCSLLCARARSWLFGRRVRMRSKNRLSGVFFFFRVMPSRSIFWCAVFCLDNQHLWTERVVSTGDELTLLKLDMVTDLPAVTGPIAKASACRVGRHHAAETKKKSRGTRQRGARGVTDVGVEGAPTEGRKTERLTGRCSHARCCTPREASFILLRSPLLASSLWIPARWSTNMRRSVKTDHVAGARVDPKNRVCRARR